MIAGSTNQPINQEKRTKDFDEERGGKGKDYSKKSLRSKSILNVEENDEEDEKTFRKGGKGKKKAGKSSASKNVVKDPSTVAEREEAGVPSENEIAAKIEELFPDMEGIANGT